VKLIAVVLLQAPIALCEEPRATEPRRDTQSSRSGIGLEISIARHLQDDEEFRIPLADLLAHGRKLFTANWTEQEGGGRPLTKGNGRALSDPASPLAGPRAFNRVSRSCLPAQGTWL